MACTHCQQARETAGAHRFFSPTCLWCGARLIQAIGRLQIAVSQSVERRRKVLADWMAMGHAEQELRTLAKGPMPVEPLDFGRDKPAASAPQSPAKSRSRARK
jgi:hypothetical protein